MHIYTIPPHASTVGTMGKFGKNDMKQLVTGIILFLIGFIVIVKFLPFAQLFADHSEACMTLDNGTEVCENMSTVQGGGLFTGIGLTILVLLIWAAFVFAVIFNIWD